jgi:hypothetical protein
MNPNTIATRKPNDMIVASTFSRVFSSIDGSFAGLSGQSMARQRVAPSSDRTRTTCQKTRKKVFAMQ